MKNIKFNPIVLLSILIVLAFNQVAFAAVWESLININLGGTKIKVELQKGSVKKQQEKKNKILTFNLHHYIEDNKSEINAYGTYKVNCNTREVWKLSSTFKMLNKSSPGETGEIKSQTVEKLKDKDYSDFQATLDIMCQKY